MIVMGVDPGLAITGYGILEKKGNRVVSLDYDSIVTSAKTMSPAERLETNHIGIGELLDRYQPSHMAIEKLFFSRNVTSAMGVSEVRGVIILAAQQRSIPVSEYTPTQVKMAITGSGKADKLQMQEMIRRLLGLPEIPKPDDVADGLSVALCHIHVVR
jgi:crossover junction endodeoxyribonuclease RuvC